MSEQKPVGALEFADIGKFITVTDRVIAGELREVHHNGDWTWLTVLVNPKEIDHPKYEEFEFFPDAKVTLHA